MAVIGEIRKRPGVLVGVIAVSIVLFLLGVAVNDQFSVLRPGRGTDAGSVDGHAIPYNEYTTEVSDNVKNIETQRRISLNDVQRNSVNQETWNDMISSIVMQRAAEKTGITVSDDEMVSLTMTENLHPMIRQQLFGNGPVDVAGLQGWIKNINVDDKGTTEPGAKRKFWNNLVKEVKKSQLQAKYGMLLLRSLGNIPKWMAEENYQETNRSADIRYIQLPYAEVKDEEIKYTDADLKDYLSKNAAKFKSPEETRRIQFVAFDVVPSAIDTATALKALTDKLEEFKNGANKSADSLFVKINSEAGYTDLYVQKEAQGPQGKQVADSLFDLPVKTVVGPYVEGGAIKFAKISAKKMMSDSVRVREIVFSFASVQSEADMKTRRTLVDSVFKAIDSLHADFGTLAAAYSDDAQGKARGGEVGWVKFADPSRDEFYKSIVFHNGEVGKTYQYIDVQNNLMKLVQIEEDKPSKLGIKVTYFTRGLLPSAETEKDVYAEVTQFAQATNTEAKFKKFATDNPQRIQRGDNITKESYDVNNLSARPLVKWIFNAKRGDVSPIETVDDGSGVNGRKHVVAYLESVIGEGTPDLESVREQVKFAFLRDKKYDLLAKKITDAKASNIDDLATKLGKQAQDAQHATFANPGMVEPAVAAAGVYIGANKLSGPIRGIQGVYAVQKVTETVPPAATDLSRDVMMAQQQAMGKVRQAQQTLRKLAKVRDNRLDFEGNN